MSTVRPIYQPGQPEDSLPPLGLEPCVPRNRCFARHRRPRCKPPAQSWFQPQGSVLGTHARSRAGHIGGKSLHPAHPPASKSCRQRQSAVDAGPDTLILAQGMHLLSMTPVRSMLSNSAMLGQPMRPVAGPARRLAPNTYCEAAAG